jgi:hypothetical protein
MFALIWLRLRNLPLLTPQDYRLRLEQLFEESKIDFQLVDVFCVPDLVKYFSGHMRGHSRGFKVDLTQLQWIFTSVPKSAKYPLGVKTEYRAYAADSAIEIRRTDELDLKTPPHLNFTPVQFKVPTFETPNILRSIPFGTPDVEPFVLGSRDHLESVLRAVNNTIPGSSKKWKTFAKVSFPRNDDADSYVKEKPLQIPLLKILFESYAPVFPTRKQTKRSEKQLNNFMVDILQGECTDSVKLVSDKQSIPPRILLPDPRLTGTALRVLVGVKRKRSGSNVTNTRRQKTKDDLIAECHKLNLVPFGTKNDLIKILRTARLAYDAEREVSC